MLPYIAYMDPMGIPTYYQYITNIYLASLIFFPKKTMKKLVKNTHPPGEGPTTMQEKGIHDGAHQRDDNALENFGENGSLGADAIFFHGQLLEFAVTCG